MPVTLLRTLTEKSLLGFGKYADMRVGEVIALNKRPYLRWAYFNCSKITFSPEVLGKLLIAEDKRIEKPGTQPGAERVIMEAIMENLPHDMKNHIAHRSKCASIERKICNTGFILRNNTRHSLQRKNHGHR
jgi:hypothetical protein